MRVIWIASNINLPFCFLLQAASPIQFFDTFFEYSKPNQFPQLFAIDISMNNLFNFYSFNFLFGFLNTNFKPLAKGKAHSACVNHWTFAVEPVFHIRLRHRTGSQSSVKHFSGIRTRNIILTLRVTRYLTVLLHSNFTLIFLDCMQPLSNVNLDCLQPLTCWDFFFFKNRNGTRLLLFINWM